MMVMGICRIVVPAPAVIVVLGAIMESPAAVAEGMPDPAVVIAVGWQKVTAILTLAVVMREKLLCVPIVKKSGIQIE